MSIAEREWVLWVALDIISTGIALRLGAHEANAIPARLMSIHPALWVLGIMGVMVLVLGMSRAVSRLNTWPVGLVLLPIPAMIECQAVLNNFMVIKGLL